MSIKNLIKLLEEYKGSSLALKIGLNLLKTLIYIYTSCVNPFCKQNDQEKGFITFETFLKKLIFDWPQWDDK
jgi:hypothetical protein